MSDLAMTFLYKDLFLRELALLDGNLVVVLVDNTQQLFDFLQSVCKLEVYIFELGILLILLEVK